MKMTNGTKFVLALVVVALVGMVIFWIEEHASSRAEIIISGLLILSALTIYGEVCESIGKEKNVKGVKNKRRGRIIAFSFFAIKFVYITRR